MKTSSRWISTIVLLLLICVGVGFVLFFEPAPPARVIMLPMPSATRPATLKDRLVQSLPIWVWRLKFAVFGPDQRIDLEGTVVGFRLQADALEKNLSLAGTHFTGSNGVKVWIMPEQELKSLRQRLKQLPQEDILFQPRISTSDGVEAVLGCGESLPSAGAPTLIGLSLGCAPRGGRRGIDLKTAITLTEAVTNDIPYSGPVSRMGSVSVRTNVALAARIQLPNRGGVFLLCPTAGRTEPAQTGILISATAP